MHLFYIALSKKNFSLFLNIKQKIVELFVNRSLDIINKPLGQLSLFCKFLLLVLIHYNRSTYWQASHSFRWWFEYAKAWYIRKPTAYWIVETIPGLWRTLWQRKNVLEGVTWFLYCTFVFLINHQRRQLLSGRASGKGSKGCWTLVRFSNWQCIVVSLGKTLYAYSYNKNLQTENKKGTSRWCG